MDNKASFILHTEYAEILKDLSFEQYGKLMWAIFEHEKSENIDVELDLACRIAFNFIVRDLDRAREKYNKTVESGKKGGAPVGNSNAKKQPKTTENNLKVDLKQPKTTLYDSDSVYDNDSDNDSDNDNDILLTPAVAVVSNICADDNDKTQEIKFSEEKYKEHQKKVEEQMHRQMLYHAHEDVVKLTKEQCDDLIATLGEDTFCYYRDKLAEFIRKKSASVKNHYKTILKWSKEDAELENSQPTNST